MPLLRNVVIILACLTIGGVFGIPCTRTRDSCDQQPTIEECLAKEDSCDTNIEEKEEECPDGTNEETAEGFCDTNTEATEVVCSNDPDAEETTDTPCPCSCTGRVHCISAIPSSPCQAEVPCSCGGSGKSDCCGCTGRQAPPKQGHPARGQHKHPKVREGSPKCQFQ